MSEEADGSYGGMGRAIGTLTARAVSLLDKERRVGAYSASTLYSPWPRGTLNHMPQSVLDRIEPKTMLLVTGSLQAEMIRGSDLPLR